MEANAAAKGKKIDWPQAILIGLFAGVVPHFLSLLLKNVIGPDLVFPVAYTLMVFAAYPLFIRGNPNPWTKDKRPWTIFSYFGVMLPLAVILSLLVIIGDRVIFAE